jgi:hypothetical protein
MSEQSIRNKIANANKKAGKILGREMKVYRPLQLNNALSDANYIFSQPAAFTVSENFQANQGDKFKPYIVYTDNLRINVGDIFSDDSETFVITANRAVENVIAYKATNIIEVQRVGYPSNPGAGAFEQTVETVIRNLPASVVGLSSVSDGAVPVANSTGPVRRFEVRIWSTSNGILKTDNIMLDNGIYLRIDQITDSIESQILTCTEVKPR